MISAFLFIDVQNLLQKTMICWVCMLQNNWTITLSCHKLGISTPKGLVLIPFEGVCSHEEMRKGKLVPLDNDSVLFSYNNSKVGYMHIVDNWNSINCISWFFKNYFVTENRIQQVYDILI